MAVITGPELDSVVAEARKWYVETRLWLIEKLNEGGYPYGTVPLTPIEQYTRYLEMQKEDWLRMEGGLMNLYKGLPDQRQRVEQALNSYIQRMNSLGLQLKGVA